MKNVLRIIGAILGIVLAVYLVYQLRTIFVYIILAVVLSLLGRPLMNLLGKIRIKNFRLPNSLSALIVLIVMILFVVGIFSLFVPLIAQQARIVSSIEANEVARAFAEPLNRFSQFLADYELTEERFDEHYFRAQIRDILKFGKVSSVFQSIFGVLGNLFIAIFSVLFMGFFFLRDGMLLQRILETLVPDAEVPHVRVILDNTKRLLTRYCFGLVIQVALVTLIISVSLKFFLGIENALIIGFMAGLLNLIPYLGPVMGAILGVIIVMLTNLDLNFYSELLPKSGWILVIFACMQLFDNMITQPVLFANVVNAHPLEIFIVISVAGTLYGITGMIIAIPSYTVLRIIAKELFSQYKVVSSLTRNL